MESKVCNFADKTWHLRNSHFIFWCFFGRGDKNEKLRNSLNLSSLLWIILLQVRFKFMCEKFFCIIKKKTLWTLFMDGVQLPQAYRATTKRQYIFQHLVPRSSWYSLDLSQKDKRLSWPRSHPVVLNPGLLNWESSA